MISIFNKTQEIHLDCFTCSETAYELTPIAKASKTIPEWWKELPRNQPQFDFKTYKDPRANMNMKNCYGFVELYKKGIVIQSWSDFKFSTENGRLNFFCSHGLHPQSHSTSQRGKGFGNYYHTKLISPWKFKEKTGVQFIFLGAEWALEKLTAKIPPGVLAFDFNSGVNVNMMFPFNSPDQEIRMGDPLVHIIPLSEKILVHHNHIISKEYFDNINGTNTTFFGWRAVKNLIEKNKKHRGCEPRCK